MNSFNPSLSFKLAPPTPQKTLACSHMTNTWIQSLNNFFYYWQFLNQYKKHVQYENIKETLIFIDTFSEINILTIFLHFSSIFTQFKLKKNKSATNCILWHLVQWSALARKCYMSVKRILFLLSSGPLWWVGSIQGCRAADGLLSCHVGLAEACVWIYPSCAKESTLDSSNISSQQCISQQYSHLTGYASEKECCWVFIDPVPHTKLSDFKKPMIKQSKLAEIKH